MTSGKYGTRVFVNCPFDDQYAAIFDAIIFTIFDCGFVPRCAREEQDAGNVRVQKIQDLLLNCRFGLHDISRVELDKETGLPRFNMPYELGVFLGAKYFGGRKQQQKMCMILERKPYSYQKYISDIAGQDIKAHRNKPREAVTIVRNWLRSAPGQRPIPGAHFVWQRYGVFRRDLPGMARLAGITRNEMTYADYVGFIHAWLQQGPKLAQRSTP